MVGCVDGVPRDAVASRDAPDPTSRRSTRAPRGHRRVATADPVDPARRPGPGGPRPSLPDRGPARRRPHLHVPRRRARAPIAWRWRSAVSASARATWSRGSCRTGSRARRWRRRSIASGAVSNPIITIYREREVGVRRAARRGSRVLVVPGMVRGVDHRELATRGAGSGAATSSTSLTVRADAGRRAARARVARGRSRRAACRRRRSARTTWRRSSTPPGRRPTRRACCTPPSTLGAVLHYHAQLFPPRPTTCSLLQFPLTHIGGIVMFVMLPLRSGSSVGAAWRPSIPSWRST